MADSVSTIDSARELLTAETTQFHSWALLNDQGAWMPLTAPKDKRAMVRLRYVKNGGYVSIRFAIDDALAHIDLLPSGLKEALG